MDTEDDMLPVGLLDMVLVTVTMGGRGVTFVGETLNPELLTVVVVVVVVVVEDKGGKNG